MKRLLVMAVAMLVVVAGTVLADDVKPAAPAAPVAVKEESPDSGFSFDATLDLYSAYVWRGFVVNDRPVYQPAASISYSTGDYGTLSFGAWANCDMTDRNGRTTGGGLNEVDYTASYSIDVSDFTLEAGHIWYTFPKVSGQDGTTTMEVYGSVAYNNDIVTPSLALYYDYDEVDGFYALAGLSREFALTDQLALGLESTLGWGDDDYMGYFGVTGSGLMDLNAGVYLSYALTDNLSVGAKVVWTSLIDGDARDKDAYRASGSWAKDLVWGGINLAASF
jgi:hypothetical protein